MNIYRKWEKILRFVIFFFLNVLVLTSHSLYAAEESANDKKEQKTGIEISKDFDTYVYHSENKRDPFVSLIVGKKKEEKKKRLRRRRRAEKQLADIPFTPLQQFELSSLKLTAIIWGDMGSFALIQAPDGKGYTIKKGTFLGKNRGRIVSIDPDRIIVKEKFIDIDDSIKTRSVELRLKPEE